MRLNRSTGHAMRILIACAETDGELVKAADLSERLVITPQNVFKIVHILSHAGLIAAQRGRDGGVGLARPAAEIRIGDVVRAMETTEFGLDNEGQNLAEASDGDRVSGVNRLLDEALVAFSSVLDRHTLSDMARSATKRPAATAKARVAGKSGFGRPLQARSTKPRGDALRTRR